MAFLEAEFESGLLHLPRRRESWSCAFRSVFLKLSPQIFRKTKQKKPQASRWEGKKQERLEKNPAPDFSKWEMGFYA